MTLRSTFQGLLCAFALMTTACAQGPELPSAEEISKALKKAVADSGGQRATVKKTLAEFYGKREHNPAWLAGGLPADQAEALLLALGTATSHGLAASRYQATDLKKRLARLSQADRIEAAEIAELETALSQAYLDFAVDLKHGQIDPGSADSRWPTRNEETDFSQSLQRALDSGVADELEALAPPQAQYARLREQRQRYADIVEQGGWQVIPDGEAIEQGENSPRITILRERLQATGDMPAPDSKDDRNDQFDQAVVDGLRRFQDRHGLEEDAVLGPSTRAALNVSVEQRLRQINANLERWRWLPNAMGDRHIIVNIPEYRVRAYEDDVRAVEMKVIVGKTYDDRETPVFTDEMQLVVFRPFWGIPHGIASEEILPEARADIGYLAQKNYQIVADYSPDAKLYPATSDNLDRVAAGELRMRQAGGPQNSLGLVKFLFPNQYAVYLHDTPADHLFDQRKRSFSHGCIRLEKPDEMAQFVLADNSDWDISRIRNAMHEGERQEVNLKQSIPVYILYWTAFMHDDGLMQFREDIYGQDETLILAMQQSGE